MARAKRSRPKQKISAATQALLEQFLARQQATPQLVETVPATADNVHHVRGGSDVPPMVARRDHEKALRGKSYEEANWAKLSPTFRNAHNQLRVAHGLQPIPPPKIDLYVPPKVSKQAQRKFDPNEDKEFKTAARQFMQMDVNLPSRRHKGGMPDEGFSINGVEVKW